MNQPTKLGRDPFRLSRLLALILPMSAPICSNSGVLASPAPRLSSPAPVKNADYRLGPEDVIEITVSNHTDLNRTVTVRPDGKITLPRAGELNARGLSTRSLALEIQKRLSISLNNARVQVLVIQARARQVRIIGPVNTTGAYPLRANTRLMDLVALAGGLSTKATRVSGRIIRTGKVIPLDIAKAVTQPGSSANLILLPDDLVVLDTRAYTKQITVMGSVAKPGAYDLEEGLTVMGLLAQAGGPSNNAALRKSEVLRNGKPVISDLSAAVAGNLPADSPLSHFSFQPGDVLNVPENQARFGVMGQVVKPSYYALPENVADATVLKAVSQAGGALADGDLSQATITRTQNGQSQTIPVNVALMLTGKAPNNVTLLDGDVLLVPKKEEKQVSVIGQVAKPGSYPLEEGTTLLSLLAAAGNAGNGAGLSRAYVLRTGVQIPINLRPAVVENQLDPKITIFRLQPNDVLVIPDVREQVQVIGQVTKPGSYNLDDDLTLMSLLSKSGNVTDRAALSRAYVLRGGSRLQFQFDLRSTVAGNIDPAVLQFRFAPGDVLVIPENELRFAVMGQVAKPGYYPFPENPEDVSILGALTQAGGATEAGGGANLSQAGIIRTLNGQTQVIPVNIDQIFKKGILPANVQLKPDDVLYIPTKKRGFKWTDVVGPLGVLGALAR
jgi:protein involved in polysaccharide export with SLBB domain